MFSSLRCSVTKIINQTTFFSNGTLLLMPIANARNFIALKYLHLHISIKSMKLEIK